MATKYQLENIRNGDVIVGDANKLIAYIQKAEFNPFYGINEFTEELSYPHPDFVVTIVDRQPRMRIQSSDGSGRGEEY